MERPSLIPLMNGHEDRFLKFAVNLNVKNDYVNFSVIQPPLSSSGQNREGEVSRGDLRSKLDHKRVQRLASGSHHDSQQSPHSFNNRRGNNFDNRDRKPRQFILVKLSYNEAENAPSIITRSAQVKDMKRNG